MLPDTLFGFSQLCTMVVTSAFGLALLFIGNAKVAHLRHFKRYKLMLSIVMMLVGCVTGFQWLTQLNETYPSVNEVLNVALVATSSFLMFLIFPLFVSQLSLSTPRLHIPVIAFVVYIAFLWLSLLLSPTLSRIILYIFTGLFIIELAHVSIAFFYRYRVLRDSHLEPGCEEERLQICLNMVVRSLAVVSVSAVLFVLFVVMTQQFQAVYYLAMLLVWGYLFVTTINQIIEVNNLGIRDVSISQREMPTPTESDLHSELSSRVNKWVEKEGYRISGVTMAEVAQELSTNRVYLSQYINSHYGCSFVTWITRLRLEYAKQLLDSTSISIDMVASRSGFSGKAQFINAFKAHEGCTPGVWRRKMLM